MQFNKVPSISIIVPCYNQAAYIQETLRSILRQTHSNWECIIVNDGSTDDSETKIVEISNADARFKYVKKKNGGVASARNIGISHARGEYLLPVDGDDIIDSGYVAEALAVFESFPDTSLVYCDVAMTGERSSILKLPEYRYEDLLWFNMIHNSSVFKRSLFLSAGGYAENMTHGYEDWELYIRMLDGNSVVRRIPRPLLHYRIQEASRSTALAKGDKLEGTLKTIFDNNQEKYLSTLSNPIKFVTDYVERVSSSRTSGVRRKYKNQIKYIHIVYLALITVILLTVSYY